MALPQSRDDFKAYCLRALGAPVLQINLDDSQIEDRIDEALNLYADYHYDGTEHVYFKYLVTSQDVINQYITLPDNILGAVRIFDFSILQNAQNPFVYQFQIAMTDLLSLTSQTLVPYYMAMQHLQQLEDLFQGQKPVRYNRRTNRFYIDMDWTATNIVDTYLLVDAYQIVDPDEYPKLWSDQWLLTYATQLIKRNWGEVIKRYGNVQLPGGTIMNGQQMWNEADAKISELRERLIHDYSMPLGFMIG